MAQIGFLREEGGLAYLAVAQEEDVHGVLFKVFHGRLLAFPLTRRNSTERIMERSKSTQDQF